MSTSSQHYANSPEYKQGHNQILDELRRDRNAEPCTNSQCRDDFCIVRECNYCDEEYQHGQDEDYCSLNCKCNGIAYDALRRARRDHTHCVSCFRRLKTLTPPGRELFKTSKKKTPEMVGQLSKELPSYGPPDHPGALNIGGISHYEFGESCYQWDVGELFRSHPTEGDWSPTPEGLKSTKTCECGVAHHATEDYLVEDLSVAQAVRRTERLTEILDEYKEREEWEHAYDTDELFSMVKKLKNDEKERASGKDFEIFERSLGAAVKAAEYR